MPVPVILAVAAASGATAAIGGAVGAAIVGSAVSATAAAAIGTAVIAGGITAAQGGDAGDVLQSAVIGGITAGVGSGIASSVASDVAFNAIANGVGGSTAVVMGNAVGGAVAGAVVNSAVAVVKGADPLEAALRGAIAGGVMSATNSLLSEVTAKVPGFNDLPPAAQSAVKSGLAAELTGGDASSAVTGSLVDSAIGWATNEAQQASRKINTAQAIYKQNTGTDLPESQINSAISSDGVDDLIQSTEKLIADLDTLNPQQKDKAVAALNSGKLDFSDASDNTALDWLSSPYLGEFPDVVITAGKEPGWQHSTDDRGYTIMWNEGKGLIQLYDEEDKLLHNWTDQFKYDKDGNVAGRGIDYYLSSAKDSIFRSANQTAALIADVLPAMAAKSIGNESYFNKQMADAKATLDKVNRDYPARVASYKGVNDLSSAATYVLESVMEGVVTTAPSLLMGGAAGVAARASAKAAMDAAVKKELAVQASKGVFGAEAISAAQSAATKAGLSVAAKFTTPAILTSSAAQNVPEVFKNVYDAKNGSVDLKDVAISTIVGGFNAALDSVLPNAIVDRLNLSKIPVEQVIGAWYKNAAKEAGSAFVKEGGTEVLQEMSSAAAESFLAQNKEFFTQQNLDRFINAGLKGGIGGSAISTTFTLGKDAAGALSSQEIFDQGLDQTTPAEYLAASQMFKDAGFDASTKDIAAITGAAPETLGPDLQAALNSYIDPRVVSEDEARQELLSLGYTDPTQDEVNAFVGQRDEASTLASLREQYNPLATTAEEAQQMMRDLGYTNLTDSEAQSLAGKIKEEDARKNIESYVNPRMVSREEAEQFFKDIGYNPTKEEVDQFVRQGANISQSEVQSEAGAYADPRMVSEQEARDAYASLGLKKPTQEDILKLVGQYDQTGLTGKATENLDSAKYNSIIEQIEQLGTQAGVDPAVLDAIKNDINSQITALGGDVAKLQSGVNSVVSEQAKTQTQITDLQNSLSAEIQAAKDIGLEGDAALQAGIDSVATNLGISKEALLSQLGTTEENLRNEFTSGIAGLEAQTKAQYDALTAEQKALADSLITQGTTLADAISAAKTETSGQIAGVESRLTDAIAAAEAMGLSRDQAITAAVESVAADLGTTKDALLTQLGTTEQALRTEFTTGISGLEAQTKAQYNALTAEQKALANQLQQQGVDMATAIQQSQTQTAGQIGALTADVQAKYNALTAAQKAEADARVAQGQNLQDAITGVSGQVTGLENQLTAQGRDFANQLIQQGMDYRTAMQTAIDAQSSLFGTQLGGLQSDIAANEARRIADQQAAAAAAEAQRQADQQAAAERARQESVRGGLRTTALQGQQQLQALQQQLPQAIQMAQTTSTPIYGEMGPYLDLGSPLDFDFFKPSPEKQAGTKQQQPTKIAAGGYIDDLLAGDMTADDLLNLLR